MKGSERDKIKPGSGGRRASVLRRKVEITEAKTVEKLIGELKVPAASILLEVNGEVFHPNRIMERQLRKGDQVTVLSLIVGG